MLRKRAENKEYIMGKTFNSGKTVSKLLVFVGGCVPASVRGIDMGVEKIAPKFHKELVDSTYGSLIMGDSKAHEYALESGFDFFGSTNDVKLSKDEMTKIEKDAHDLADATGDDYDRCLQDVRERFIKAKLASK
jgi:hypothetical protein